MEKSQIQTFIRYKYQEISESLKNAILKMDCKKTFILYGRSGSGKTFTCKEILTYLFTELKEKNRVNISELYCDKEEILIEKNDVSPKETVKLVNNLKRKIVSTTLNNNSSRSIIFIKINDTVIVDLMGSENVNMTKDKVNYREGIINNKSLLELTKILRDLKNNVKPNYRNCKLTMILKLCFTKSNIVFIGCCDKNDVVETNKTIQFINTIDGIVFIKEKEKEINTIENVIVNEELIGQLNNYNDDIDRTTNTLYELLEILNDL